MILKKNVSKEQINFLKKLSANKHLIDVVSNDEEFFNKLGGQGIYRSYTSSDRKTIIEDAILFASLLDTYSDFTGFKGHDLFYFLKENPWMIDKLRKSDFLFTMCGGDENIKGRNNRMNFIKSYIEAIENS